METEERDAQQKLSTALTILLLPALLLLLSRCLGLQRFLALADMPGWRAEYLLLLAPALLLWACFDRAWAVWLAEGIPLLLLSLVNLFKLRLNGAPLELGDFSLLSGAGEIVSFALPQLQLDPATAAALLLWAVWLAVLILLRKHLCLGGRLRLIPLLAGAALAAALLTGFAAPEDPAGAGPALRLYAEWSASMAERRKGGPDEAALAEIREQLSAPSPSPSPSPAPTPAGESAAAPVSAPEPTPEPEPVVPTVIFLMSESFFDVTELPGIRFERDPLETFQALAETQPSG